MFTKIGQKARPGAVFGGVMQGRIQGGQVTLMIWTMVNA